MTAPSGFLKKYSVVVITGGSSGIGRKFVEQIYNFNPGVLLINVSRSKPEDEWAGIPVLHRQVDLSSPAERDESVQWLASKCEAAPEGKLLLVNNSGFGSYGRFPSHELEHQLDMVEVNVSAVLHITGVLLPELKKRGGGIINVSSLSAMQPTPYMATYGASKAFLLNWSLALWQELKNDGIHVLAVCPGPTKSNFYKSAGFASPPCGSIAGSGTPEAVVAQTLRAFARGKSVLVPGWRNKIAAGFAALLCRSWQAAVAELFLRKLRLETYLRHL
ncbi:MAG TPA: SDR family NAD(P)-dependent oxidoreductase [Opitutales bacterium]|nr:SDR family NAD(P)-dependent oxidoreductase [Opitutales bacterium]